MTVNVREDTFTQETGACTVTVGYLAGAPGSGMGRILGR